MTFEQGATVLGAGTLSGGSANFTTSALAVGSDYVKAVYAGDAGFTAGSSKSIREVVR